MRFAGGMLGALIGAPIVAFYGIKHNSSGLQVLALLWCATEIFFLNKRKKRTTRLGLGFIGGLLGAPLVYRGGVLYHERLLRMLGYLFFLVELCYFLLNSSDWVDNDGNITPP